MLRAVRTLLARAREVLRARRERLPGDAAPRARTLPALVRAAGAVAGLSLVFWAPAAVVPSAASHGQLHGLFARVWLEADVVFVATVALLVARRGWTRATTAAAALVLAVAWVFDLYDLLVQATFQRRSALLDDVRLISRAGALVADLRHAVGPELVLAALVVVVVPCGVVPWLTGVLVRAVGERPAAPRALVVAVSLAWVLVVAAGLERGLAPRDSAAQSSLVRLGASVGRSLALAHTRAALAAERPFDASGYDRGLVLARKPDVWVIMVESYGRVSSVHPRLAAHHDALLRELDAELAAAGWSTAAAFSDAPVSGGNSWMSAATVLGGVLVDDQRLFELFTAGEPYVLPRILARQGYATIGVYPSVRVRPGLPLRDPYGFATWLTFERLGYRGPSYGWGVVPDEFSLGRTVDDEVAHEAGPSFVYFAGVSSHAPWGPPPPRTADWRTSSSPGGTSPLTQRLRQKLGPRPRGAADALSAEAYEASIEYDLRLVVDVLAHRARRPAVVVILGDHQPPYLVQDPDDVATPVHLLATDPAVTDAARALGFTAGLRPGASSTRLQHQGLLSALVHLLARTGGAPGSAVPPVLVEGFPRAALLPREASSAAATGALR